MAIRMGTDFLLIYIDDYSHHIGVDIADKLRLYYCTQLPSRRSFYWLPLLYLLLDATTVNSYTLCAFRSQNIPHMQAVSIRVRLDQNISLHTTEPILSCHTHTLETRFIW